MKQKITKQIRMNWCKSEREKFFLSRFSSVCTWWEKFPRLWHFKFWHNLPLTVNSIALPATWWFWSFGPYFFQSLRNFCFFQIHSFNGMKKKPCRSLIKCDNREREFFLSYYRCVLFNIAWQSTHFNSASEKVWGFSNENTLTPEKKERKHFVLPYIVAFDEIKSYGQVLRCEKVIALNTYNQKTFSRRKKRVNFQSP